MNKKTKYNLINMFVILLGAIIFSFQYKCDFDLFINYNITILVGTVVFVHLIKVIRLYFILYGTGINNNEFIKTYCKITPISMILPFKIGEFFRMYCYGNLIGSVLKGIIIILLDRFMDTAALVTIIFLIWLLKGGKLDALVYLMIIFLVILMVIYFTFPGIKKTWSKYLLKSTASESKLKALKVLDMINSVYLQMDNIVKGRGVILYLLSLVSWGIEISSLYILCRTKGVYEINQLAFDYLKSAIYGSQSIELKRFVIVSVLFLIVCYAIMKIGEFLFKGKRGVNDENNSYL